MEKQDIMDYVLKTPENTNPAILKSMLDQLEEGSGGGGGSGGDVISGDVIYKFREPKTDIDFTSNDRYQPKIEEVIIKNIGGKAHIQPYLSSFERVIVEAPLSIPNGGLGAFYSNSNNYETRYLYLSDKIVSMEDYAFSDSRISGNVVVDCGFSEDKFPTAMAKAVELGIEVNYNIPEPRSIGGVAE